MLIFGPLTSVSFLSLFLKFRSSGSSRWRISTFISYALSTGRRVKEVVKVEILPITANESNVWECAEVTIWSEKQSKINKIEEKTSKTEINFHLFELLFYHAVVMFAFAHWIGICMAFLCGYWKKYWMKKKYIKKYAKM